MQPGETKSVVLVRIGGKRVIRGGNGFTDGPVDVSRWPAIMNALTQRGIKSPEEASARF